MKNGVALFDLDHTLTRQDSLAAKDGRTVKISS